MPDRSPNYPGVSLDESVANIKALFSREHRNPVPPEIAAQAWGYRSLSGIARVKIGALRQFGLIESSKDGTVKVSSRGMALAMRSPGTPEYSAALREAALAPAIFRELHGGRSGSSDEALRHHLVADRRFIPEAADRLLKAFRKSTEFAGLHDEDYDHSGDEDPGSQSNVLEGRGITQSTPHGRPTPSSSNVVYHLEIPLAGGFKAQLTVTGSRQVTQEALDMFMQVLTITKKALPLEGNESTNTSSGSETIDPPAAN